MPVDTSTPPPGVAPTATSRASILIVDDEPAIRMIARFILEAAGYAVAEAGTAAAALLSLHTSGRSFAVILLDFTLPDRNGTDLLPELRVVAPGAHVILTSGRAEEDVPGHGADGYLPKPFNREQLLAAIRTAFAMTPR